MFTVITVDTSCTKSIAFNQSIYKLVLSLSFNMHCIGFRVTLTIHFSFPNLLRLSAPTEAVQMAIL